MPSMRGDRGICAGTPLYSDTESGIIKTNVGIRRKGLFPLIKQRHIYRITAAALTAALLFLPGCGTLGSGSAVSSAPAQVEVEKEYARFPRFQDRKVNQNNPTGRKAPFAWSTPCPSTAKPSMNLRCWNRGKSWSGTFWPIARRAVIWTLRPLPFPRRGRNRTA